MKAPFIVKLLHHTVAFSQLIQELTTPFCLFHFMLSLCFHTILPAVLLFSFDKYGRLSVRHFRYCSLAQSNFTGLLFCYNSATHITINCEKMPVHNSMHSTMWHKVLSIREWFWPFSCHFLAWLALWQLAQLTKCVHEFVCVWSLNTRYLQFIRAVFLI